MIYFLLPAFNEEKDLPRVFEEFIALKFSFPYQILVVNDGSTDGTAAIIEEYKNRLPVSALNHKENKGLGAALEDGFSELIKHMRDNDILITIDSDGTHPLDTVHLIKQKIESGADAVVASRFVSGAEENGVGLFRRFLSHSASFGLRILWPINNISDYSSGFRGYSNALVSRMNNAFGSKIIEDSGFSANLELLLKASLAGGKFNEVPLKLNYDAKKGKSKLKVSVTIIAYFKLIIRMFLLKSSRANRHE